MSLTRPLTRPLTRKISRADLTQGFGGSFSPFALNPYLLFDARDSMVGTLENPTLDLNPALPETLDVITATRTGVATFTDANGNIATAPANTVRVDQTQGAELTPTVYQNVVQTDYSASPNGGFNMNLTDIDGPEGASGGVRVSETAANGQHYLSINEIPVVSGQSYTVSFYIKEGSYSSVRVYTQSSKINSDVNFNFSTGTATFGGSDLIANSGIVSTVGGGWYRVSYSAIASNGGLMSLYVTVKDLSSYLGDVNNFTDYYGFQVEEGTTATTFVANTTGSPKFITGATFGPRVPMILIEPSSENLLTYSEDFSHGSWTKDRATLIGNSITSPDGSLNASKLVESVTTGTHRTWTQATTTAAPHSFSVFAKAGERKRISLRDNQIGNSAVFDLESGSVISGSGGSIAQAANGFFRITLTGTYAAAGTRHEIYVLPDNATTANTSYTGDGTSGLYIWGAQVETGSVATSYIPTSGSTVQRAADDLVISGSAFSGFFNGSEGTFYLELVDRQVTGSSHSYIVGQSASQFFLYKDSGSAQVTSFDAGTGMNKSPLVANQLMRLALTYKSASPASRSLSLNGSTSDGSYNGNFSSANILKIGGGYTDVFSGHFRRILFWPYHSDNL